MGQDFREIARHADYISPMTYAPMLITRPSVTLCIQVLTPVDQNVALQGPFSSGTYVVRVNGLEREFRI